MVSRAVEDNDDVDQPYIPEEGYDSSKDLADKALRLSARKQTRPQKAWYMFFCPGANDAPHHVPEEYIEKNKGKFDDGDEVYRELVCCA